MSDTPRTDKKLDEMSHCPRTIGDAMIVCLARELERELAELRKDKERLDWVQEHGQAEFTIAGHQGSYYSYEVDADTEDVTVRDAIDSAMESKP